MSCFVSKLCSFLQLPFTSTWRKFSTEKSFLTLTAIHRCEFSLAVKVFSVKNTSWRVFHFWITNLKRMEIKLCYISCLMKLIWHSTVLRSPNYLSWLLVSTYGPTYGRGSSHHSCTHHGIKLSGFEPWLGAIVLSSRTRCITLTVALSTQVYIKSKWLPQYQ